MIDIQYRCDNCKKSKGIYIPSKASVIRCGNCGHMENITENKVRKMSKRKFNKLENEKRLKSIFSGQTKGIRFQAENVQASVDTIPRPVEREEIRFVAEEITPENALKQLEESITTHKGE